MTTVNIHEAKTQFSKLVEIVESGGEVLIARRGTVVAKLVSVLPGVVGKTTRHPGRFARANFGAGAEAFEESPQAAMQPVMSEKPQSSASQGGNDIAKLSGLVEELLKVLKTGTAVERAPAKQPRVPGRLAHVWPDMPADAFLEGTDEETLAAIEEERVVLYPRASASRL